MKLWHFTLLIICCSTFSDAQNNDSGYFAYLRDIYDQHETELYDFLLQELDRFVLLFPHSPLHADVLYMEASVHSSKGDDVRQFAALLKLLSLYPDFSQYQSCRDDLGILVSGNKTFAPKKADILNFLSSFGDDKDASHRFYRVLEFLISLEMKDLNDWLLEQLSAFQMLYPDYPSIEQSYFWSARIYKSKKQYDEAGAVLGKMEFLHPNSPYIETARLERALLLYQAGSYQSALPVLEELTASESKELQITCYFYLGELYEKKVKDYDKAVHHYTVVVENPAHSMAKAAIDRLADIYQKRLKSPTKAAEINAAYRTLYPQDEKASLYLLKAAELEEKYGAPEKALYYYTQIITAYPNSSEYDQAFSRTKDLKARGVKSTDDGGGVGADHPSHSAADENEAPEKSSSEENAEKHAGIIGAGEHTGMPSDTLKTIDDEAEIAHATIMSAKESQARKDYIEYYLGTQVLDVDWNGSVANCEAGELDPEILRKAELRINYFRRLVGLAEIKLADQYNLYAQHAALMMHANNALSHTPSPNWKCYSQEGARGAQNSNLGLRDFAYFPETSFITGMIYDHGASNKSCGHRRWLLNSLVHTMGYGLTPRAEVIYVTHIETGDVEEQAPEFIAYPPAGFMPASLIFPKWSFCLPAGNSVDFVDAQLRILLDSGEQLKSRVIAIDNPFYFDPGIIFQIDGFNDGDSSERTALETSLCGKILHIHVTNVKVNDENRDFSYTVHIMNM